MTDRRLTPVNDRVGPGAIGRVGRVSQAVVDLCHTPDGPRDRQLLLGAGVTVFETHAGWHFVQAQADGYCGYVDAGIDPLADDPAPTHRVASFATHAYVAEDFKSPEATALPFGAQLTVTDERRTFFETPLGFVPKKHLRPLDRPFADPVTIAQLHFQAPYLWGGNSTRGIDCSGLIQAALLACGQSCPGDSDLQRESLGADASGPYKRGDLLFWKGHVGMMVDPDVMIHANAHHMAVAYEPIQAATTRIAAQGDGPLLAHKRLPLSFE